MVTILMMSPKMATPGFLKIKVFLNKRSYIIIFLYGITNKILSLDSNNIVDVAMWPKVIRTSIL